jgi:hypothetical protein
MRIAESTPYLAQYFYSMIHMLGRLAMLSFSSIRISITTMPLLIAPI